MNVDDASLSVIDAEDAKDRQMRPRGGTEGTKKTPGGGVNKICLPAAPWVQPPV